MIVIHNSLVLSDFLLAMMWAACCLGFFGFLRAGKFTVNSPYNPGVHFLLTDLQMIPHLTRRVDVCTCSKTDPFFRVTLFILVVVTPPSVRLQPSWHIFTYKAQFLAPLHT